MNPVISEVPEPITFPEVFMFPTTSNASEGVSVLTPTLPASTNHVVEPLPTSKLPVTVKSALTVPPTRLSR